MNKAEEKMQIEYGIQDAARLVPQTCRPVFSTMMRQEINGKSPLTFGQISSGCQGHWSVGASIMRLCALGYIIESSVPREFGDQRVWRLKTLKDVDLSKTEVSEAA